MRSLRFLLLAALVAFTPRCAPAQTVNKNVTKASDGTNAISESLAFGSGKTLTLNGTLAGQKNTTGAAVNESITVGGVTRTLAVPKDAAKVEGSLTLGAEGVLYLSGNFGVEKKDATLTLADGSTVLTTAIQIGASSLTGWPRKRPSRRRRAARERYQEGPRIARVHLHPGVGRKPFKNRHLRRLRARVPVLHGPPGVQYERELTGGLFRKRLPLHRQQRR